MSREKQIEEMSGVVGQAINHNCWLSDERMEEIDMKGVAEELYNAGYRKQSEGEWVKTQFVARTGFYTKKEFPCNQCGETFEVVKGSELMHFCPNCGAKMKGGAE